MPERPAPAFGFHNDRQHGGSVAITCVAAPIDRVSLAYAAAETLVVDEDVYGKPVGDRGLVAFQYADLPCTVMVTRNASPHLAALSATLGVACAAYEYEKVSDWEQLRVFADGRCVETYSYGLDYSDEMADLAEELGEDAPSKQEPTDDGKPFDHRVIDDGNEYRFRSERRTVDASLITDIDAMLDAAAKFYGLVFPEYDAMPGESKGVMRGLTKKAFARVDVLRPARVDELPKQSGELREGIEQLDVERVRAALAAKPDVTLLAGTTWTPMQRVMEVATTRPEGAAEVIRLLAAAGADPNAASQPGSQPPIVMPFWTMAPVESPEIAAVAALLDVGADPNVRVGGFMGHMRYTLLHVLAAAGNLAAIKLACAHGADPTLRDAEGLNPREFAMKQVDSLTPGTSRCDYQLPRFQAVIAYLERVERGESPRDG